MRTYTTKPFTPARDVECLIHTLERMRDGLLEAEREGVHDVSSWDNAHENVDLTCWTFGHEATRNTGEVAYKMARVARDAVRKHAALDLEV